jgi:hypothetical protein
MTVAVDAVSVGSEIWAGVIGMTRIRWTALSIPASEDPRVLPARSGVRPRTLRGLASPGWTRPGSPLWSAR